MRLFFAISIPPEINHRIDQQAAELTDRGLRLVPPENRHFTLQFLGEVKTERVGDLCAVGKEVATYHHPFELIVAGAGFFPDKSHPRVFWLSGRSAGGELTALAEGLAAGLKTRHFKVENRPFQPHLTIVRINMPLSQAIIAKLFRWEKEVFGSFLVTNFCLMESELLANGARYYNLATFSLGE